MTERDTPIPPDDAPEKIPEDSENREAEAMPEDGPGATERSIASEQGDEIGIQFDSDSDSERDLEKEIGQGESGETVAPLHEEVEHDIVIEGFTHLYGGFEAVRDLNVAIPRGTITGFIGPNGAGKTTTIHLLATLLTPTQGDAWIVGESCTRRRSRVRRLIGYMPDSFGVYEGLDVREYLQFFAEAYKLPSKRIRFIIDEVVDLLNLGAKLATPVEGLSRGQLQRLSLARALLHDPRVLILDEPASGLDPIARLEFLYILRELRRLGKTILLSSHILTEVSEVCDSLMIMSEGRLVAHGSMSDICASIRPHFTVEAQLLDGDVERAASLLRSWGVQSTRVMANDGACRMVEFDFVGDERQLAEIHQKLVREGVALLYFKPIEVTLEQAFATLTGAFTIKTALESAEDAFEPPPPDFSI